MIAFNHPNLLLNSITHMNQLAAAPPRSLQRGALFD